MNSSLEINKMQLSALTPEELVLLIERASDELWCRPMKCDDIRKLILKTRMRPIAQLLFVKLMDLVDQRLREGFEKAIENIRLRKLRGCNNSLREVYPPI